MNLLREKLRESPVMARVLPFAIFVVLTAAPELFGEESRYWFYVIKTAVGAWLIWEMRPYVAEMRWAFSWEAVAVGVAVFVIWVGLDNVYPKLSKPGPLWNPHTQFGFNSGLAWMFIIVRIVGSSIVVPPLEETFYRSFVYRYLVRIEFLSLPLGHMHLLSFVVTSAVFGFMHYQWLAGILCGLAYQGLVVRKNRLGDAMTAHAITNFLLGVWVAAQGDWKFW